MATIGDLKLPDTPNHLAAAYWTNKLARKEIEWWVSEIEHWKQRCVELEIELECIRNAFPEHDNDVRPKQRGIF